MQVVADQLVGGGRGAGHVAAHLLAAHPGGRIKGEEAIYGIAWLLFELVEGDAAPVYPGWGASFEPAHLEAQCLEGFAEANGGLLSCPAGAHRLVAHPDLPAQEGAGGEDYGGGAVAAAEVGADAADAGVFAGGALHHQPGHHRFAQGQVWRVLQQLQHLAGVLALVGLGAQGPHSGAAAGIEHPLLQGRGIGQPADHASEGIHLMHQLALGRTAHRRVAGLPGDAIEVE